MKNVKNRSRSNWNKGAWFIFAVYLLVLTAFVPIWPYSMAWGYYPSAGVGLLFVLFIVLFIGGAFEIAKDASEDRTM